MTRYDYKIGYGRKKHYWKEMELIYLGTTQILILEID
jgi:hypothetical protein